MTERDSIEDDKAILDAARHENDAGDQVFSVLVDVGAEQPHDQRAEVRPRAREPAAGPEHAVRRQTGSSSASAASSHSMSARRTRTRTTSPVRATPTRRT